MKQNKYNMGKNYKNDRMQVVYYVKKDATNREEPAKIQEEPTQNELKEKKIHDEEIINKKQNIPKKKLQKKNNKKIQEEEVLPDHIENYFKDFLPKEAKQKTNKKVEKNEDTIDHEQKKRGIQKKQNLKQNDALEEYYEEHPIQEKLSKKKKGQNKFQNDNEEFKYSDKIYHEEQKREKSSKIQKKKIENNFGENEGHDKNYADQKKFKGKQENFYKDDKYFDNDYRPKKIRKNINKNYMNADQVTKDMQPYKKIWTNKQNYGSYEGNNQNYDRNKIQKNQKFKHSKEDKYERNKGYKTNNNYRRNGDNKKFKYVDFLIKELVEKGLEDKSLYEGIFLANDKVRSLASIKCEAFEEKVFVQNLQNQNRALHNCTVVFKLISDLPPIRINKKEDSKSLYYSDMIKVYVKKGEAFASPEEINRKIEQEITKKKDSEKKNSDSSEWETEEENINTNKKPTKKINENSDKKKIGEVVYIMKNDYNDRDIIGKIEISEGKDPKTKNQNNQTKINYVFIPNDKRLPKMFINKMGDEPYDLIAKHEIKLENSYFIGKLLEWPNYSFYPHVEITGYLGIAGDIENECKALLLENKVFVGDFEEKTREHLSEYENGNWEIPNEEKNKRMNLTKSLICTIDPSTARDLDDALSIEEITPGVYEIGVHIADVSYFIKENDPVDSEARKRTTSVYLPHRVIPMLPGILCEKLCSLNPGVERLAFSIFFKMNENGDWLKNEAPRIGKSIIKSCGKLSYEVAQMIIEGDIKQIEEVPEICKVDKTIDGEKLLQGIKKMNEIAQKRRAFRVKNGSLQFNKKKKKFQLNEQNIPVTFSIEERKEANFLVEEYMLLANIIAGETMVKNCEEIALLRKHELPQEKKIKALKTFLDSLNNPTIDTSNIFKIYETIENLKDSNSISSGLLQVIDQKMIRTMQLAKYFIVDNTPDYSWHHFALNFDVYTHFTSPIRRYPDVLVHRLLFNILEFGEKARECTNKEYMIEIMNKCNECKQASRKVSDGCDKIFSCLCMKANNLQVFTKALVLSFGKSGMTISVPEFDLMDLKINFMDFNQIRDVSLNEEKTKLSIKVSSHKNKRKHHKIRHEFLDKEEEEEEAGDVFWRKFEFEIFNEIDVKLGVKEKFPIDYQIWLAIKNDKNELEIIS